MVVVTVKGSTRGILEARQPGPRGGQPAGRSSGCPAVIGDPHRVPELRAVDQPRRRRRLALARLAQLACDHPRAVDVHALADQWRAVTAGAALGPGEALVQAAPQ